MGDTSIVKRVDDIISLSDYVGTSYGNTGIHLAGYPDQALVAA